MLDVVTCKCLLPDPVPFHCYYDKEERENISLVSDLYSAGYRVCEVDIWYKEGSTRCSKNTA